MLLEKNNLPNDRQFLDDTEQADLSVESIQNLSWKVLI